MIVKLALGWDRVSPAHELDMAQDGFVYCRELQNYIVREKRIKKVGGTTAYNSIDLGETQDIPWVHRSYHKRADGTFRKVAFCFSNGVLYSGNDVSGVLTSRESGMNTDAIPMHATMQVSGNSIMYFYTGENEVRSYNGNASYNIQETTLNDDVGRIIESATVHLDRMWYVTKNSSIITYSTTLKPEDISTDAGDITIGQESDSVVRRIVVGANETMYIFKNQSIWQLFGRTVSTFQFRRVTDKYGLANKRAIYPTGSGFVFLDEFTKELYFFGGTESSIMPLTEKRIKLRDILDHNWADKVTMTVHDGLFRCAFKHIYDDNVQDRELVYPINEPGPDGLPKWSMIKGTKVLSYSVWNQQGDKEELVTGRSDTGKMMYHNRGSHFDNVTRETIIRTGDIVASEDKIVRFKGFYIKAKPGVLGVTVTFEYYLNTRTRSEGSANLDMDGERRSLADIQVPMQVVFNDRIIPLHNKSLGNSISFRMTESTITETEIYSIAFTAMPRYKIRNQLVAT